MTNSTKPQKLLGVWLEKRLPSEAWAWLDQQVRALTNEATDRDLYFAVSMALRKVGKSDVDLSEADFRDAKEARPGWTPKNWSVDQAARLLLMLAASPDGGQFASRLEQLCNSADVRELIAFYQGLPLYPDPERYIGRAGEGLRTNMKAVFEAVAHNNPYPFENFEDGAWNQMVLKAIFVGSPLNPIQGLDQRRNLELAQTLIDYAHERWVASRAVTPELWRMVGPFADEVIVNDLRRPLTSDLLVERHAAVLALRESPHESARPLVEAAAQINSDIEAGHVSWETVCRDLPKT